MTSQETAIVLKPEQQAALLRLKSYYPFRIIWGEIVAGTDQFTAHASINARAMNKSARSGNTVVRLG